jgi:type VI secretion system protein VasG
VAAQHQARLDVAEDLVAAIQARCTSADAGARHVEQFLDSTLLPAIATQVLQRMAAGQPLQCLRLGLDGDTLRCTAA